MVRIKQTAHKNSSASRNPRPSPEPYDSSSSDPSSESFYTTSASIEESIQVSSESESDSRENMHEIAEEPDMHARNSSPPVYNPSLAETRRVIRGGRLYPERFETREAWEFAVQNAERSFIIEAQFNGIPGKYHHDQGWDILVVPPPFANATLVREFYANLSQTPGSQVYLRGMQIDNHANR